MPSRWSPYPRLCSSLLQRRRHRRLQPSAHSAVKKCSALHNRPQQSRCRAAAGASPAGQVSADVTQAAVQPRSHWQRRVRLGPGLRVQCLLTAGRPVPAACMLLAPPACSWTSARLVRGWWCRRTVSALLLCSTAQKPQVPHPPAILQSPPRHSTAPQPSLSSCNLVFTTYVFAWSIPVAAWRCAGPSDLSQGPQRSQGSESSVTVKTYNYFGAWA